MCAHNDKRWTGIEYIDFFIIPTNEMVTIKIISEVILLGEYWTN